MISYYFLDCSFHKYRTLRKHTFCSNSRITFLGCRTSALGLREVKAEVHLALGVACDDV